MNSLLIAILSSSCIFGGTLFSMTFRARLPGHHLSSGSKDVEG